MNIKERLFGKVVAASIEPTEAEKIRGVPDSQLKFIATSNLWLIAMARLMQAEGVDDEPLIEELYKRGRSEVTK